MSAGPGGGRGAEPPGLPRLAGAVRGGGRSRGGERVTAGRAGSGAGAGPGSRGRSGPGRRSGGPEFGRGWDSCCGSPVPGRARWGCPGGSRGARR